MYHISIIGSVPGAFMNPTYSEEIIIDLTVADSCPLDKVNVDPLGAIED